MYIYYPAPHEAFEEIFQVRADALVAVSTGHKEEAIRQIQAQLGQRGPGRPPRVAAKRTLSVAARRRIAAAQRKRWAAVRESQSQGVAAPKKRKLSAAGRRAIIAATKKRWAAVRKAAA